MGELLRQLSDLVCQCEVATGVDKPAQPYRLREGEVQRPRSAHSGLNRIVCSAVLLPSGVMLTGVRHWDQVMISAVKLLLPTALEPRDPQVQGFLDRYGSFHTREEAWIIAFKAGQIIHRCGGDNGVLYSENLY